MFCHLQSDKRSHESPMDFEWQTHAPIDPKSPFPQAKYEHKGFNSVPPLIKSDYCSPETLLKNPNSSFTTPQKVFEPEMFSETSGIDSSPGEQYDAEDKLDKFKSLQSTPTSTGKNTFKKPIFGKYGTDFLGTSPSRTDQRRTKYRQTIIQKMRKRKRINRDTKLSQAFDSDSEDNKMGSRSSKTIDPNLRFESTQQGLFASFFTYIESHPNLPSVLSFYAQLTVNLFIAGLMIFGIHTFWTTVRADVDKASEQERSLALAQIAKCAQDFVLNGCGNKNRAPVMEIPCNEFDLCMNRDPDSVGRARISAHTFAQIFNSFIEPISYKAMIFIVLIVIVTLLVNNLAFGLYRSKTYQNFFPDFYSHSFQPWMSNIPTQNLGHGFFTNHNFQNVDANHTRTGTRNSSRSNRNRERSISPKKIDRDGERDKNVGEIELYSG